MNRRTRKIAVAWGVLLFAFLMTIPPLELVAQAAMPPAAVMGSSLVGIWTLTAADNLLPDGTRVHAYGEDPRGILVFGADGRYTVQIFRSDRAKFSSGDKAHGTPEEYRNATVAISCHFGRYSVDPAKGTITFHIERASFPNWDGATQTRPFTLEGDDLSWRVPATPDGSVPISAWRRAR
ncbi:lipocalin-like domain-containing protein [Granulicella arctica]|uniref:Lipocalin-like domain-containing protein n=1 Tax=Granulicella arctica TaxID=940613 RepID=A0A7Y9PJH8_9BACT|nr:lipocalin-like domain-containing protein [Granulicella arctica]NYF81001.1 hypothetical protein [Granulicella arctica]